VFFGGPVQSVVDGAGASGKSGSLAGSMPLVALVVFWAVTTDDTIAKTSDISVPAHRTARIRIPIRRPRHSEGLSWRDRAQEGRTARGMAATTQCAP